MPRKRVISTVLMTTSVRAALRLRGSLKAVMPLEMASMPVSAVEPLEKARRIRNSPSGASDWTATCSTPLTVGSVPVAQRKKPMPSVRNIMPRKK